MKFNEEEQAASENLLAVMDQLYDWGLDCNHDEVTSAVHTLQLFLIKHMLQREGAEGFGDWYDR